ncbi:MAG: long-chain fatty acid--CoA ligase [Thermoleophilia bacterium]
MQGLMMHGALTLGAILDRAERVSPGSAIVSRGSDRSVHRGTYAELAPRARRLAAGLRDLGVPKDGRVATLMWNQREHLEAYYGVPARGAVVHTLNPRLSPAELAHIADHAGDEAVIVDASLLDVLGAVRARRDFRHVIVAGGDAPEGTIAYEDLLAAEDPGLPVVAQDDELAAAVLCYTSGTTGNPKGVLYSHRALVLHAMGLAMADSFAIREADTVLPVVPMFHVNAWGLPFTCPMTGAQLVLPGRFLDPDSLLELLTGERVTFTAGVPTVWLALLERLDEDPGAHDLSALRCMLVGGSAAPRGLIEAFERRHGLHVLQGWGMTEMCPVGSIGRLPRSMADAPAEERLAYRARQGQPVPFVEIRARHEDGLVPWDGTTMGELEVRGPTVASAYMGGEGADKFTDDGWFRTGDIVTIGPTGCIEITDREKDLIKSGGEWISSVALENALMAHPAVAEAAVVAIPDPKWQERPLACVVTRPGHSPTAEELRDRLAADFPSWWLPDRVEFIDEIPRTATGKFKKAVLRERFAPPAGH